MTDQVREIFRDMLESPANPGDDTSLAIMKLESVKPISQVVNKATKRQAAKRQADDDNPPWEEPSSKDKKEKTGKTSGKVSTKERAETRSKDSKLQKPAKEIKKTMATRGTTKVSAPTTQKNSNGVKVGKRSAAQMFRELILSNSYDDDTIFKMVQKEFDLDDKKRSYVSYYRRELQQKGLL